MKSTRYIFPLSPCTCNQVFKSVHDVFSALIHTPSCCSHAGFANSCLPGIEQYHSVPSENKLCELNFGRLSGQIFATGSVQHTFLKYPSCCSPNSSPICFKYQANSPHEAFSSLVNLPFSFSHDSLPKCSWPLREHEYPFPSEKIFFASNFGQFGYSLRLCLPILQHCCLKYPSCSVPNSSPKFFK